jgi:hypothetical protein
VANTPAAACEEPKETQPGTGVPRSFLRAPWPGYTGGMTDHPEAPQPVACACPPGSPTPPSRPCALGRGTVIVGQFDKMSTAAAGCDPDRAPSRADVRLFVMFYSPLASEM